MQQDRFGKCAEKIDVIPGKTFDITIFLVSLHKRDRDFVVAGIINREKTRRFKSRITRGFRQLIQMTHVNRLIIPVIGFFQNLSGFHKSKDRVVEEIVDAVTRACLIGRSEDLHQQFSTGNQFPGSRYQKGLHVLFGLVRECMSVFR